MASARRRSPPTNRHARLASTVSRPRASGSWRWITFPRRTIATGCLGVIERLVTRAASSVAVRVVLPLARL